MDAASQIPATTPSPAATWQVWRIDDNGNTFLMREHLTQAEADCMVAELLPAATSKRIGPSEKGLS